MFGYVRDFIQFAFWQSFPVFNFADVFLTVGVVMFIIYLLIYAFKKEKKPAVVDTVGKIVIEEQLDKDEEDDEIRKQVIKNNEFKMHNNIEEDKTDDKNE